MADTKRLTIMKALTTELKKIDGTGGYALNLQDRVYRGRNRFGQDEAVPAVALLEALNPDRTPDVVGFSNAPKQKYDWIILIQGWAHDDKENPTDPADLLMGEVKKCLGKISDENSGTTTFLLGGLIEEILMEPGTVRPPDETSEKAYFWMRVSLAVVEKISDPFDIT